MSWLNEDGTPFTTSPNIKAGAMLNLAGAEKLFAMTQTPWAEISAAAESDEGAVQGFDLGVTMRIETDSQHSNIESPNVVGILPGSDPDLRNEYIVLTAHLDHDGVKPSDDPDDDEIYNGAMDNAVGIAALIEVAQLLASDPPARSVIFVALTAEEKGLIGSDYYARNPTVPADAIVANINLDMPILTYDFTDIVAYGAERSTLYPIVERATADAGLTLSPDPAPEQNVFTRSDQYSFVKQGVPAVYLKTGFADGGEEAQKDFRSNHYHQATDEADLVNSTLCGALPILKQRLPAALLICPSARAGYQVTFLARPLTDRWRKARRNKNPRPRFEKPLIRRQSFVNLPDYPITSA